MRSAVVLALALALIAESLLFAPAVAANDALEVSWRRCADRNPVIAIAGCDAIIRSRRETGPRLAGAYYNRGIAHRLQGHFDHAIRDHTLAIRLKPEFAEAYVDRGIVYYEMRQYDRAIADYGEAIRLQPELAEAFNNRCLAYLKLVQYERATLDFNRTILLNQNYGNAMINRSPGPIAPQLPQHGAE